VTTCFDSYDPVMVAAALHAAAVVVEGLLRVFCARGYRSFPTHYA